MYILVFLLVSAGQLETQVVGETSNVNDCYALREYILYDYRKNDLSLKPGVQAVCIEKVEFDQENLLTN